MKALGISIAAAIILVMLTQGAMSAASRETSSMEKGSSAAPDRAGSVYVGESSEQSSVAHTDDVDARVTGFSYPVTPQAACYARIESNPGITYTTVQTAVDAAVEGDTVKIAGYCAGVESRDSAIQTVYISKTITLRGGYTTTHWETPDPEINPTTLDAQNGGRVVFLTGGGNVVLENLHVTGGKVTGRGGGIYNDDVALTLDDTIVISNSASDDGGGLCVWSGSATLHGGQIIGNKAGGESEGGGVYIAYGSVTLDGGQIISNTAGNGGGVGISTDQSTFIQTGLSVISHNIADNNGGGVYINAGCATFSEGQISGNDANDGGGVFIMSGSATLSAGQILSNTAEQDGGGVHVRETAAAFTQTGGSTIAYNTTIWGQGGGVYVGSGRAALSAGQISDNSAGDDGGGVYVDAGSATLSGGEISDNSAGGNGGGIYLTGDAMAQVLSNQISGNTASNAGGGAYISGNAAPVFHSNQVLSNTASKSGGGIYVGSGIQTPTIISNTVIGNTSWSTEGGGGGIYITGRPTLIKSNTVSGNRAASNRGGGIYLTSGATAQVLDNDILENEAAKYGGGIYVKDSPAMIQSNVISANHAITDGGGLYLTGEVTATVLDNYILDNEADDDGGGVLIRLSGPYLENNIVADNQASDDGSGLYISGSSPRLFHTTVACNGGGNGRGVFVTYATVSDTTHYSAVAMTNTILVGHAAGIYVATGNTATLTATLWGTDTWANDKDWNGNGTIITGSANIRNYPVFVTTDKGPYHIGPGSAAVNRALTTTLDTDIDGDERPIGKGPDLGADECLAALSVSKQATPDPVQIGEQLTYTLRVANTGCVSLSAAITDTLPGYIAPGETHSGQPISPGGILSWTPTITAPGGVWTETFVVTVGTSYVGPLVNVVQVTTKEGATGVYTETSWAQDCYAQISGTSAITYPSVQAAVNEANDGDTVKVAGYCAGVEARAGVTQTVYISKNITLRGGYTTTNWTASDPLANPTTLDAAGRGRVLYITGDIGTTVEGLGITGGDASGLGGDPGGYDAGGGVYIITAIPTITLNDNQVFSNTADLGGGLYLWNSHITLNGNTVAANTVDGDGGGLYLRDVDATLSENAVTSNTAGLSGGGLFLFSSDATLNGNAIVSNTAIHGGGVLISQSTAAFSRTGYASVIARNTAIENGGGVCVDAGRATLEGGQIISNTAGQDGGGVYIAASDGAFTQTGDSAIANNSAKFGGGVYVVDGNVTLSGGQIISNSAKDNGGGVFTWGGDVTLRGGQIISNSAAWSGGGIHVHYNNATFVQTDVSTITRNTANFGGGVYVWDGSATLEGGQIISNLAESNGGGVYVNGIAATFVQTGVSTVAHNTAVYGGGVYIMASRMTLKGGQIIHNSAGQDGGGVYIADNDGAFTQTGVSTISHNTAPYGGGVYVRDGNATLSAGQIIHNEAENNGGGMFVGNGSATLSGGQIISNSAYRGGGVHVELGDVTLNGGQIADNSATWNGGGLYIAWGSAVLSGGQIISNSSELDGGGVHVRESGATFVQTGVSTITHNTANYGGGVYVWDGSATLSGGQIISNLAHTDGGGVNVQNGSATFLQTGVSTITHNTAHYGGGVYVRYGSATLEGGQIISNSAWDGGGVYVWNSGATFLQTGVSTIAHNTADFGGGVYVQYGSATLSKGQIGSNSAITDGGGIYAIAATLTVSGSQIMSNTAQRHGGGLYLYKSDSTLINDVIADNLAGGLGSGLYITNASPRLWHTTIARNGSTGLTAGSDGDGNGIYVANDGPPYSAVALTNAILVRHAVGITVTADNTATLESTLWGAEAWANDKDWGGDGTVITSGNVWGDPIFVAPDAGDYHIGPGSAAINMGISTTVNTDIDGDERPIGNSPDLGADECRAAALRVSKRAAPDPVQAGERLTYTLHVANIGCVDLNATVTDTLPLYIVPGMHSGQPISPGGVLSWTPTITAAGGVWTETVVVTVEAGHAGPLVNVVQATTDEGATGIYTETTWAQVCYAQISGTSTITYTSVQAAVDAANDGDTVKVAGYCAGVGTRAGITQTVYISKNITLRGGYTTTNWITPDLDANPTTLGALRRGRVLYITGDISVTVEGLHITGGDPTGLGGDRLGRDAGGGVYVITATVTISDNWVFNNVALANSFGGGLYLAHSNAILSANSLTSNTAAFGGGAYLFDTDNAKLINNLLSNNAAYNSGAGLYFYDNAGGMLVANTLSNNGKLFPGMQFCAGANFSNSDNATLVDNVIRSNLAGNDGGGLCFANSNALLERNAVIDNQAIHGGGLILRNSSVELINNLIADNRAVEGGGVYVERSSVRLLHTTIAHNSHHYGGSGIRVTDENSHYSTVALTNTILVSHTVGITVTAGNTATLEATLWGTGTWANDKDWGGDGTLITGSINIWGDPDFVAPNAGDYHIRSDSAARDAGVNAGVSTDMDGEPRPLCLNEACLEEEYPYDIGADEWMPLKIFLPLVLRDWPPIPAAPELDPIDNADIDGSYTVWWSTVAPITTTTQLITHTYTLEEATNSDFTGAITAYSGVSTSQAIRHGNEKAGHYYYRVKACNIWTCGGWSGVEWVGAWWEKETNDDALTQANGPIISGSTYFGVFPSSSDVKDYFYFDLGTAHNVELWLTNIPDGHDYALVLRDDDLKEKGLSQNPGNANEHILTNPLPAGRYYVQVYNYSQTGSTQPYHLRVVYE